MTVTAAIVAAEVLGATTFDTQTDVNITDGQVTAMITQAQALLNPYTDSPTDEIVIAVTKRLILKSIYYRSLFATNTAGMMQARMADPGEILNDEIIKMLPAVQYGW